MKKIIVLSLLAVMLTGCVKQADYDNLVRQNTKLESKIEDLEDDIDDLKDENNKLKEQNEQLQEENKELSDKMNISIEESTDIDIPTTTDIQNETLFNKEYKNNNTGDRIWVIIDKKDGNNCLNMSFFPSEADLNDPIMYESKCVAFFVFAYNLNANDYYNLLILDSNSYCSSAYISSGDKTPLITSYDRDETYHMSTLDGKIADWLEEGLDDSDRVAESSPAVWIYYTMQQIENDIKGIYP